MTTIKRKRGRPRTRTKPPPVGSMKMLHPFERLPDGEITEAQKTQIVKMIRRRAAKPPVFLIAAGQVPLTTDPLPTAPQDENVAQWMEAAAQALEDGDGSRAAYYLLNALRSREMDLVSKLGELAQVGTHKLATDKKKGRRGRW